MKGGIEILNGTRTVYTRRCSEQCDHHTSTHACIYILHMKERSMQIHTHPMQHSEEH